MACSAVLSLSARTAGNLQVTPITDSAVDKLTRISDVQQTAFGEKAVKSALDIQNVEKITKSGMAKAPAKAPKDDTWVSRGDITYTDCFMKDLYDLDFEPVQIPCEESVEHPGYFRIKDPYTYVLYYNGFLSKFTDYDDWCYINATDANKVYLEVYNTGYSLSNDVGSIYIYSKAGYYVDNGNEAAAEPYYGKLADNCITFPVNSLFVSGSALSSWYTANQSGNFRIAFPGAKDYSIKVEVDNCADGNIFKPTFTVGADVAKILYAILPGNYTRNESNYQLVPQISTSELPGAGTYNLNYSDVTDDCKVYTMLVAALDADGNYQAGDGAYFFVINDNNDQWTSLGKTKYVDDLYASQFSNVDCYEMAVEIQENKATPGYYRLVNPYAEYPKNIAEENHNHYMYIDASNPEAVSIPLSPIGLDGGYGMAMTISKEVGTLADGKITFPEKGLLYGESDYSKGSFFYANANSGFLLEIPSKDLYIGVVDEENEQGGFKIDPALKFTADPEHEGNLIVNIPAGTIQDAFVIMNENGGIMYGVGADDQGGIATSGYYTITRGTIGVDIEPLSGWLANDATFTLVIDENSNKADLFVTVASAMEKVYAIIGDDMENIVELTEMDDEVFALELPAGTEKFYLSTDNEDFQAGCLSLGEGGVVKNGADMVALQEDPMCNAISVDYVEGQWNIYVSNVEGIFMITAFNETEKPMGDLYIGVIDEENEEGGFKIDPALKFTADPEHEGNLVLNIPAGTIQDAFVIMNADGSYTYGAGADDQAAVYQTAYLTLTRGTIGDNITPISGWLTQDATFTLIIDPDNTATAELYVQVAAANDKVYAIIGDDFDNIVELTEMDDDVYSIELPKGTQKFYLSTDDEDFQAGCLSLGEFGVLYNNADPVALQEDQMCSAITLDYVEGQWTIYVAKVDDAFMIQAFNETSKPTTGIEDIIAGEGQVEYFNLHGIRVANPENGTYIIRRGNTVTKQLVR